MIEIILVILLIGAFYMLWQSKKYEVRYQDYKDPILERKMLAVRDAFVKSLKESRKTVCDHLADNKAMISAMAVEIDTNMLSSGTTFTTYTTSINTQIDAAVNQAATATSPQAIANNELLLAYKDVFLYLVKTNGYDATTSIGKQFEKFMFAALDDLCSKANRDPEVLGIIGMYYGSKAVNYL